MAKPPLDARSTHTAGVIQDSDYARVGEAVSKMQAASLPGLSTPDQNAWGFGMGVKIEQAAGSAERRPRKPDSGGSVASSITLESFELPHARPPSTRGRGPDDDKPSSAEPPRDPHAPTVHDELLKLKRAKVSAAQLRAESSALSAQAQASLSPRRRPFSRSRRWKPMRSP